PSADATRPSLQKPTPTRQAAGWPASGRPFRATRSQRTSEPAQPPDRAQRLSRDRATQVTSWGCPTKLRNRVPSAAFHRNRPRSGLPERICVPSAEKTAQRTLLLCPVNWQRSLPLSTSQTRRADGSRGETASRPSGEKASARTQYVGSVEVRSS